MTPPSAAKLILDREFLEIRGKILELAASFDRLDRAGGGIQDDARIGLIQEALEALSAPQDGRAEQVQMIFSRDYDKQWRENYGLTGPRRAK